MMRSVLLVVAVIAMAYAVDVTMVDDSAPHELGNAATLDPVPQTQDELNAECLEKTEAEMKTHCESKTVEEQCGWAVGNMHDW